MPPLPPPPPGDAPPQELEASCWERHVDSVYAGYPFSPCKPWEEQPGEGTLPWTLKHCDTIVAGCIVRDDVVNTAHVADESQLWFRSGTMLDGATEMVSMHPTRVNMPAEGRFQEVDDHNKEVCTYALAWPMLDENGNQVAVMGNTVDSMHHHNIVGHPVIMTQELKDALEAPGKLWADTFEVGCQYWVFGRMTARKVETWYFSQASYCGYPEV